MVLLPLSLHHKIDPQKKNSAPNPFWDSAGQQQGSRKNHALVKRGVLAAIFKKNLNGNAKGGQGNVAFVPNVFPKMFSIAPHSSIPDALANVESQDQN